MTGLYGDAVWVRALARLPSRQLHALLMCLLALLAALLWQWGLRLPIGQLQVLRGERSVLEASAIDATVQRQIQQIEQANLALSRQLGTLDAQHTSDRILVDLIGAIDRVARRHGVVLDGATPGPVRQSVIFDEVPVDFEARGNYQALVDWLVEVEQTLPTLAIVRFAMQPAGPSGQLAIKLRAASYRLQAAP